MKALLAALLIAALADAPVQLSEEEELRAQALMREIRCVACENEPISQSASDIAVNMKERVRTLVAEGASDAEVRAWFAERYGEFVLFRPESRSVPGLLLWGGPFAFLLAGAGLVAWLTVRKRRESAEVEAVAPEDLSA